MSGRARPVRAYYVGTAHGSEITLHTTKRDALDAVAAVLWGGGRSAMSTKRPYRRPNPKRVSPSPDVRAKCVDHALRYLLDARDMAHDAGAGYLLARIDLAVSSAYGARRIAQGRRTP